MTFADVVTLYAPPVGAIAVVAMVLTIFWRYQKNALETQRAQIAENNSRIERLETDNRRCRERVDLLITTMQLAGVAVPEKVWLP